MKTIPLEYGNFYHIYNRGINGCNLFRDNENYEHFLYLYDKYVGKVADTFAWVLMKNHFHFLIRIKSVQDIPFMGETPEGLKNTSGSETNLSESYRPESVSYSNQTPEGQKDTSGSVKNLSESFIPESVSKKKYKPSNQFSHLFNAYTKAINKRYHRTGSLFEHPFRRIPVATSDQLKYLVYYIHHNPIHHGFCEHFLEYPWSSYLTMISPKQTKLSRDKVLEWFEDKTYFEEYHSKEQIEKYKELEIYYTDDN
jgi:hypothetical protein